MASRPMAKCLGAVHPQVRSRPLVPLAADVVSQKLRRQRMPDSRTVARAHHFVAFVGGRGTPSSTRPTRSSTARLSG